MTQDEFLTRYHSYRTQDKAEAHAEMLKANNEGIEGNGAVAVQFPPLGWTLMLVSAVEMLEDMGMLPVQES